MSKLEFKPEEFEKLRYPSDVNPSYAYCHYANTRLAEMLKDAKVAYGRHYPYGAFVYEDVVSRDDTHRALLINIEELEPCRHEPLPSLSNETICRHCSVKLVARWEAT